MVMHLTLLSAFKHFPRRSLPHLSLLPLMGSDACLKAWSGFPEGLSFSTVAGWLTRGIQSPHVLYGGL